MHGALSYLRQRPQPTRSLRVFCLLIVGVLLGAVFWVQVEGEAAAAPSPSPLATGHPSGIPTLAHQQRQGPEVLMRQQELTSVDDWEAGVSSGLLISNNSGGELRLAAGKTEGSYLSQPFSTTFAINAAGSFWRADFPAGTGLVLELRGRSTPPSELTATVTYDEAEAEEGWGKWQTMIAGDARSQADDGALAMPDVLAFPPDTRYLQLRASFSSDVPRASAILNELTLVFLNTMQGPSVPAGLPQVPIIFGEDTLTPRPRHILRSVWSARRLAAQPGRTVPRGIVLHQVHISEEREEVLPLLRALATYQVEVLGWDDMAYHYLIDENGILYEGRMGGPTSDVARMSGGDSVIHVALIDSRDEPPSTAAEDMLIDLGAWLCQAYDIEPLGTHPVLEDEAYVFRKNIVGHQQIVPEAPDPGHPLLEDLLDILEHIDRSIIRTRSYFPEGNAREYTQQFMFFNPGHEEADIGVVLLPGESGRPLLQSFTVPPGGHTHLAVNDVLSGTASLSAIVQSNGTIIAERSMDIPTDISVKAGISQLSRIWYFADGSTEEGFETYLILLNPHDVFTEASITYMRDDGTQAVQQVYIPARKRLVVTVKDALPDVGFGARIIADRPIAAERTMRFGPDRVGMHIGPGVTQLSRSWYFAEGTTDLPFRMQIQVLNPHARSSRTTVTFMTPDGTSLKRKYIIPPTTRLTVDVNEVVPTLGVATTVESEWPLVAERSLYFDPQERGKPAVVASRLITTSIVLTTTDTLTPVDAPPLAGTVGPGARQPAYVWYFAYGRTSNTHEYLLLSNPGRRQARVTINFVLSDGVTTHQQNIVMPPGSRYTLAVHDFFPDETAISTTVRSTQPIIAERSLFVLDSRGGGTTTPGVPGE